MKMSKCAERMYLTTNVVEFGVPATVIALEH